MNTFRLGIVGGAIVAALALTGAATATPPTPITVRTDGHFTSVELRDGLPVSGTVEGVWSAIGTVNDSGAYTETWQITGDAVHCLELLVGSQGTIVMARQAAIDWVVVGVSGFFEGGSWEIVSGTGAYERLHGGGGGLKAHTSDSFGDFDTNVVHEVQLGVAHFD